MTSQPHSPSAERRARRSHILESLLAEKRAVLARQAERHCARRADAEDALQEACLAFLGHYEGPAGVDAVRWMQVVIKRCAWALGRSARQHEALLEVSTTDEAERLSPVAAADLDPAHLAVRAETLAEREAELAALKPDERTALVLFAAGVPYREIAERRRWTHTKVNRCIAEGRAALPSYRRD